MAFHTGRFSSALHLILLRYETVREFLVLGREVTVSDFARIEEARKQETVHDVVRQKLDSFTHAAIERRVTNDAQFERIM